MENIGCAQFKSAVSTNIDCAQFNCAIDISSRIGNQRTIPMTPLYTAHAAATGGREGSASSSDGKLEVRLSTPKELGGAGGEGTNPEQLFAAGYSACFLGALKFVASQSRI